MIAPTVGRVVWFYHYVEGQGHKGPMAAIVAFVHSDTMVSLAVFSDFGGTFSRGSVPLVQDDEPAPGFDYCTWMPYQKGQAAKTEALEKQLQA